MKKFRIITILAALTLAFAALALTGCSNPFDPHRKGYTVKVVYDFNVYDYEVEDKYKKPRVYFYKPDTPIIKPEQKSSLLNLPPVNGVHVIGWKVVETDENGNPQKDIDGNFMVSDDVDFSTMRTGEKNSVLYLLAIWGKNYTFTIDVGEDARQDGVENNVDTSFSAAGTLVKPGGSDPTWEGHTFYYYYSDPDDDTSRIYDDDWEKIEINDENPNVTVYVKWLEGDWTVVTESSQLEVLESNMNYLLDNDIDFAVYGNGADQAPTSYMSMGGVSMYSGIFDGNGYMLKNFVSKIEASGNNASDAVGLFPSFAKGGCIKNVTFENCTVSVNLMARQESERYYVGFFCGNLMSRTDPSAFTDIQFVDCELSITTRGTAKDYTVIVGESDYFGVFGQVGKSGFVLADENRGITVKINNEIKTQNKGD